MLILYRAKDIYDVPMAEAACFMLIFLFTDKTAAEGMESGFSVYR
jgi:hypothetical protein